MQYCPKCRLNIRGEKAGCPLCGGRLAGDPEPGGFPVLEKRRFSHMSVVKVATFCCLSMFIILMAAEILCDFKLAWVPFVVLVLLIVYNFTDSADDRRERAIERANLRRERRLRKERGELVEE